ncbi:hypothetical protein [Sorangium sp. So ce1389]|uniref:hypothetical protein n=1 Tax=Sorangium sp. So ce1389 TaxID=3133336 RepID=UPI003F600101
MSFRVVWNFPALATFYSLPMHSAFMIDRAVVRFAETGEGELAWEAPYHLLSAGFHDVVLAIDREARAITVLRIYRVR